MTPRFSRPKKIFLLALIALFVSSACLTLTPVSPETTASPPGDISTQDERFVLVEGEVAFGPGTFDLAEPGLGLSDLSGYKATLVVSYDGTQAGQASQWSRTYEILDTQQPASRQLTLEKAGDVSDPGQLFLAEMDGAAYERRGESNCTATVIDPGNTLSQRMEPAGFLLGVIGAEAAGSETVNGVASDHYTFDERALGLLGIAESTGEVWVATDGGYVVKYVLTITGTADYFGEGIEGSLSLDYELTGEDQSVVFKLPADCPAGMVNAPLLPDASNSLNMPGSLTYDTLTSLTDASAFYQAQIPGLGWLLLGTPTLTETMALLEFTQGAQKMTIIITNNGKTIIHILIASSQE